MRPVRAEGNTGLGQSGTAPAQAQAQAFTSERAALRAFYGAKIEAARRSTPAHEIAAAVAAMMREQRAAFRALADRRQAEKAAMKERRSAARHGDREEQKRARPLSSPS